MIHVGDIMSTVGDILSTVGDTQYREGYSVPWGDIMIHVEGYPEYRECCSVPWRYSNNKRFIPHGTQDIPHGTFIITPKVLNIPPPPHHGTEHTLYRVEMETFMRRDLNNNK